MNDCNEIWAVYEQTAAQPPQYQPTSNDKKAMQLNAAAQKPQVAPQVNVQVMPQPQTTVRAQPQMTAAPAPSVVSQDEQQAQQEQEEHQVPINIARPQTKDVKLHPTISVSQKARLKGMLRDNFNNVIDSLQQQLLK